MTQFRTFFVILVLVLLACAAYGQRLDEVLATSTSTSYKVSSLSPDAQKLYLDQRKLVADTRTSLLAAMISNVLLDLESKAQNLSREKLIATQKTKIAEPTPAEIKAVYDANRNALGGRTLEESRPQIIEFIKHEAEDKALDAYVQSLRTKYKVAVGKDINSIGLGPAEVLATIGEKTITARDFEQTHKLRVNDIEMTIFEEIRSDLETAIFDNLLKEEAKARNLDTGSFIASEITDKLRQFTDEERVSVESDLMKRLFAKYNVKIQLTEPTPLVQDISTDDDPQTGSASAPVTVVMFTDFQCPACAATHPILKNAIAAYGDRIRFVVRDYPLEELHKDSFQSALAANAARAQGKFAEYTEILYRNQHALDKASLVKYATELGLNVKQFELDFSDAKAAAEVRKDQADGRSYGIAGTPTIFVNGIKVHRLSLPGIRSAIDRALKK